VSSVDIGRALLGASALGAVVLAVGFGVVIAPGSTLSTDVRADGGGVCGTFPAGSTSAAGWFLTSFRNDTGHGIRVRDVRAGELRNVALSHLSIATNPSIDSAGLTITTDPAMPRSYGRTVPTDSGVVVPAHGELDVVGRVVLDDGADAGRLHGLVVTTEGPLGTTRSVTDPTSFGVGIGVGHDETEIGCLGA
jgi:hypothetical protein